MDRAEEHEKEVKGQTERTEDIHFPIHLDGKNRSTVRKHKYC